MAKLCSTARFPACRLPPMPPGALQRPRTRSRNPSWMSLADPTTPLEILNRLDAKHLPVHELKVDRSFVSQMLHPPATR